ncbi:hypothetical protein NDU88_000586 [Pleurodeles waltl]|uniref:Uncharacterized protein n=1 Tax=Pleurodeles waltl TaxID=8319 RepID=A0AAV7V8F1_PLEWA|nr:hypothetical protein NDU88_000586 [Pleurodeles waltl]
MRKHSHRSDLSFPPRLQLKRRPVVWPGSLKRQVLQSLPDLTTPPGHDPQQGDWAWVTCEVGGTDLLDPQLSHQEGRGTWTSAAAEMSGTTGGPTVIIAAQSLLDNGFSCCTPPRDRGCKRALF